MPRRPGYAHSAERPAHFVLVTEGVDLLEWPTLDALFEAGCGDASVGHDTLEFDREAPTRDEALCSALRDAESVPGLRVVRIEVEAADGSRPIPSSGWGPHAPDACGVDACLTVPK